MKIRLLETLATLKRAGAENVAVSLACRLDPARFETAVVSLFDPFPGGLERELERCARPVWHLGKHPGFDARIYGRLRRVLREFRPDIVHSHSYLLRYTFPAALASRVPHMVHTVHNVADKEVEFAGRMLHRIAFRWGVAAVAVGQEVARSFRSVYSREVAAVVPNGVDLARLKARGGRLAWRCANGFSEEQLLIVSVGRLDPQKEPLVLIEAFARAFKDDAGIQLLLAGAGTLLEAARERARELGAAGQVQFLGVRDDVPDLLAACDIFVLASAWEGMPLSVIEASAAGLPVVATSTGGVSEIVEHGRTGLLVAPADKEGLASALERLARDADLRASFGEAGRRRSTGFGIDAMIDSYAALFERIVRSV